MKLNAYRMAAALLLLTVSENLADLITGGRPVNPERSFTLCLTAGQVSDIEGGVTETTRQLFELEGRDPSTFEPESYTFEELGLTDSDTTFGISMEKVWRYFTLRGDFSYMQAEARSTPPRDFFIGVDEIEFEGKTYEYMKLEDGVPYEATLDAALISFAIEWTPFTLGADRVLSFTPWVHLGFFAIAGGFEISQGEAQRIQIYENPPREYVVGGTGEGSLAGVAPEIGVGGEFRLWLGRNAYGDRELAIRGVYAIFEYEGSSDSLGIDSRNEKDLDVEYSMATARATLYWPISGALDLVLGAEYRLMTAEADSRAQDKTLEEAALTREKFDKFIELNLTIINAFVGLRF